MSVLHLALDLLYPLFMLFFGLALCCVGGYGLDSTKPFPTLNTTYCFLFGASMVGSSGGSLEQWFQIVLLGQKPHSTVIAQVLLVLGALISAEAGMYLRRRRQRHGATPAQA